MTEWHGATTRNGTSVGIEMSRVDRWIGIRAVVSREEITITARELKDFLTAVKNGDFDHLVGDAQPGS